MQSQQIQLDLNKMSVTEKLIAINQIWGDLLKKPESVPSPEWHKEVLVARSNRVADGISQFKSLNAVKQELQLKFK